MIKVAALEQIRKLALHSKNYSAEKTAELAACVTAAIEELTVVVTPVIQTITLPASGWSNDKQIVSVAGVTEQNAITPIPVAESWEAAGQHGIRCTAQAQDSLTFACLTAPKDDLIYNVLIQEVR